LAEASPEALAEASPEAFPEASPVASPETSPEALPEASPQARLEASARRAPAVAAPANLRASRLPARFQTDPDQREFLDGWIGRYAGEVDAATDFAEIPSEIAASYDEAHINFVVQVNDAERFRIVERYPLPEGQPGMLEVRLRGNEVVGARIVGRPFAADDVPDDYMLALQAALDAYLTLFGCEEPCADERARLDDALRTLATA
jgi:hypothetical protein